MPIWPTTTLAKAALFNKYGRGIVHMGLHIGVARFIVDRGGRMVRKKKYREIDIVPYIDRMKVIDDALNSEAVELVTRDPSPINVLYSHAFNGTGNDWKEFVNLRTTIESSGGILFVDMNEQATVSATLRGRFALSIDGQIDRTTQVQCGMHTSASGRNFRQMMVAYVGSGKHDIGVWWVMDVVESATVRTAFGLFRIVTLNVKRSK